MKLRAILLSLALCAPLAAASAQDKPAASPSPAHKTPEQLKAEQKEKDLKKANEDLDKELKGKKTDAATIAQAEQLLTYLATGTIDLDVKQANDLVHKVLAKKIPIATDVYTALSQEQQKATDPKTNKLDVKKMIAEFQKWIASWKPAPSPSPAPAGK